MCPQWLPQKITGSILSTGKDGEEKVSKHKWLAPGSIRKRMGG